MPVVVIPPVIVVDPRCAPELIARDHQRLVQQSLGLVGGEQCARRLLQDRGLTRRALDVTTALPAAPWLGDRRTRGSSPGPGLLPDEACPRSRCCGFPSASPPSIPAPASTHVIVGVQPESVPRTTSVWFSRSLS